VVTLASAVGAPACPPLELLLNKDFVPPVELAAVLVLLFLAGRSGRKAWQGSRSWPWQEVIGAESSLVLWHSTR
jgi:hypothetical protein